MADISIDGLFKSTSSDERKYWGLVLFQHGLSVTATPDLISNLFSAKLTQCLMNHLGSADRYLHRAAEKARRAVVDRARTNPDIKIMVIEALLMNGYIDFDRVSKTRTIEELLSGLDETATSQICEIYNAAILQPGPENESSPSQRRQMAADQLVSAAKSIQARSEKANPDNASSERSVQRILSLLTQFAYFDLGPSAQPEISTDSRNAFKARISSCLTYLAVHTQDPSVFAFHVAREISEQKSAPAKSKLLLQAENDVQEVLDQTVKIMRRMNKEARSAETSNNSFLKPALLLLSVIFLQVHDGDLDAIGMLEELNGTFSKQRLKHNAKGDKRSSNALVEILLALISKPSKLFRRLSQQVFCSIAADIDESGLQSMLKVLNAKEDSEGQNELFDQNNSDEEEEEQDDDDESLNSDAFSIEISDIKKMSQDDQISDGHDETASSSANDDSGESLDEGLAAFNAKLAQTLGTRPGNDDLNDEEGDGSDEDMNDEEMEALDEHLANVFREQKKAVSKKSEKKDAKKTIVNFKCRVLELLEMFVKQQHGKRLTLLLLLPLLTLLRTTSNPQVSQKTSDLLREYSRLSKGKELQQVNDAEPLFQMLEIVHQEALKTGSNAHASACSQASLLLVRILAGHEVERLRRVVRMYADTYAASQEKVLFEKNSRIKMSLFTDFNNWAISFGK